MARTNRQTRNYIDRIIEIKDSIDVLNAEKRAIANKLGMGTWRSRNFIGRLVKFTMGSGGWRVSWKDVAAGLARQLKMSDSDLLRATYGHRKQTYASPCVSVTKDTAKRPNLDNPNISFI